MQKRRIEGQPYKAQYRLPADLGDWLKAQAEKNTRSVNGELIAKLKEARQREQDGVNAT